MPKQKKSDIPEDQVVDDESAALLQQIEDLTLALQRERADSVNLRRRHEEQIASLNDYVKADVIQDLLPVIDNFERSIKHIPKELQSMTMLKELKASLNSSKRP